MSPDTRRKLLYFLVRLHFAYLIAIPLLGLISWWFIWRSALTIMIIASFAPIAAYSYSRMFISGEVELRYGGTRAALRAGADWLDGPLQKDKGFALILIFAILIVLSPFVYGLLKYVGKVN